MTAAAPVIFLAAGGTGGHMFPALALGQQLLAEGMQVKLVTDRRLTSFETIAKDFTAASIEILTIPSATFSGHPVKKLLAVKNILAGILKARQLVLDHQAKCIVGFGGYPSFPTAVAAKLTGRPLIIHEQNAILGRANRQLAKIARFIASSFPSLERLPAGAQAKLRHTGNPVREAILKVAAEPAPALTDEGPLQLLVIGGSLGASVFSDVIPEALKQLPDALRQRIHLTQQVRTAELESVQAAYQQLGVQAELLPFFSDMPAQYAKAQLVIARAGASTVAELLAARRPGLLVPYPHAMDDHQTANAKHFVEAGGGWMQPQPTFTAPELASRLQLLLNEPDKLNQITQQLSLLPPNNAATQLAALVKSHIG